MVFVAFATAQGGFNTQAENFDTVIVASTANFPDAMVSAGPATKLGIPVLLTGKDQLSQSTRQTIERFDVNEVIIVGGPAVVSEDVESELSSLVNSTTRLWGMSQIGTSIEVSDYFWSSGSEEVIIAQYPLDEDKGYRLLMAVKNEMQEEVEGEDAPILVSDEGSLSTKVLQEVEDLGATEARVYSTDAVNVTEDLEGVGVEEVEVKEAGIENLTERLEDEEKGNVSRLVVVAAANFRDAISASSVPRGTSFLVDSEDKISDAVQEVRDTGPEEIFVVGKPDLAQRIADRIEEETGREVDHVSGGEASEVASMAVNRSREDWSEIQSRRMPEWINETRNAPGLKKAANRTINRASDNINENSSEKTRQLLTEAQQLYDKGNYFEARRKAVQALSEANVEDYREMDREEIRDRVREEREDMREAAKEMKELSQEQARKMREAESMEERLEIIQEFRQERREKVRELRKEAMENADDRRRKLREKFQEETSSESSRLRLKLDGYELRVDGKYVAPTGGYSVSKQVEQDSGVIDVDFSFSSPDGPATQALTEHEVKIERSLENGSYTVEAEIVVDGETVNSFTEEIDVPGFEEREKRHRSSSREEEFEMEREAEDFNETEFEEQEPEDSNESFNDTDGE